MTCIVGLIENDKVYIGGDSAGVAGYHTYIREDEKVFKNKNMIFGYTSSFRMGQLLRYKFSPPPHNPQKGDYEYMCTDFIDEVIKCFKNNQFAKEKENVVLGGTFLIGYNKNLYYIDSDFQVGKNMNGFAACGCGDTYALGALKILQSLDKSSTSPEDKIIKSLEIAEYFSAGVRKPFNIVSL